MGKLATDGFIDGGLDAIANCTALHVTSGEAATFAAIAGVTLATVTINGADLTIGNGDTSGRKVAVSQQADIAITGAGTQNATHVVITDGTDVYNTTCTSQALTNGGTVTVPTWDIEIADPV